MAIAEGKVCPIYFKKKTGKKKYPNNARFSLSFLGPVELVEHLPHSPIGQATLALPAAVGVRTSPWSRGKSIGLDLNGLLNFKYMHTHLCFLKVYIVINLWMRLSVSYICMLGYVLSSKRVSQVSGMVWPARYQNAIETMNCPTEPTWTLGKPRHTCPCWILLFRKFSDIQINIKCTCKSSLKLAEGTKDITRSQQSNREFCFSPSTISTTWVVPVHFPVSKTSWRSSSDFHHLGMSSRVKISTL